MDWVWVEKLIVGALITEDGTLVTGLLLFQQQKITITTLIVGYTLGVLLGDLILYALGFGAYKANIQWIKKWSLKLHIFWG